MKPHKAYIKAKRAFLAGKQCAVYPWLKATQLHHKNGRLGPLLTNRRYWLAVSAIAHAWIHANPNAARAEGYLAAVGKWNSTPRTKNRLRP
jgi:hypothetical protein